MRVKIFELKDMTDSRMLMEHQILPITFVFLYGLITFIAALLLWASVGEVDVVVKARGSVRPAETIATMTSKTTGKILNISVQRGEVVKQGDVILCLDDAVYQLQMQALLIEQAQMHSELQHANRFINGLMSGNNPFSPTNEEAYYFQFEKYKMDQDRTNSEASLNAEKLSRGEGELRDVQQLIHWFDHNDYTKGKENSSLSRKFELFLQEKLDAEYQYNHAQDQLEALEILYKSGGISKMEVENAIRERDRAQSALETLKATYRSNLVDRYYLLEGQLAELRRANSESAQSAGIVNQINWQITKLNLEKNLALMATKINNAQLSIDACKITASRDGVFQPNEDFAPGDRLNEGTVVGTIVPEISSHYQAEMAIGNQDISKVRLGDEVKFKLDALPYKEYGFIKGRIVLISPDAIVNPATGVSYYKVVASFDNQPLTSYKGIVQTVKVGMSYEAHVITERKKIIWFIFEKLQLSL